MPVRSGVVSPASKELYYKEVLFQFDAAMNQMANSYLEVCYPLNIKAYGTGEGAPPAMPWPGSALMTMLLQQVAGMQNIVPQAKTPVTTNLNLNF